jgi:negative regulator of sigma E activity
VTTARAFWLGLALMLGGLALIYFWSAPRIDAGGLAPFDLRTHGYTFDEARAFLTALTPEGRAVYLGPQRVADTIFPVGFAATMMLLVFWGLKRLSRPAAWAGLALPLAYFAADMAENAAVAGLLRTEPTALTPEQVARASTITIWKSRLVDVAIATTVLALAARAIQTMVRRRGWHA